MQEHIGLAWPYDMEDEQEGEEEATLEYTDTAHTRPPSAGQCTLTQHRAAPLRLTSYTSRVYN
jgi:hypothetical protein